MVIYMAQLVRYRIIPGMTCFRLIDSVKASSVLRREFVMLMPLGTGRTEFGQLHRIFAMKQRAWIGADPYWDRRRPMPAEDSIPPVWRMPMLVDASRVYPARILG